MSILRLSKIVWCGLEKDKKETLKILQSLGSLQIIPAAHEAALREVAGPTQKSHDAFNFLMDTAAKPRQISDPQKFDVVSVEKETLELREAITRLGEEKDFLTGRIKALKPWGSFTFPSLEDMKDLRFWFYVVPNKDLESVSSRPGVWKVIKTDDRYTYVTVIAKDEPDDMPVVRVHAGAKPLNELEERLEMVEDELYDLNDKKRKLSRWCKLYRRDLFLLENEALRSEVSQQTVDQEQLFALEAWVPKRNIEALRQAARESHAALSEREPDPEEAVPTLLDNPPLVAGGADLVTFYMTPGYRMWDPSVVVFYSFAVFFAMILSDAGYAALLSLFLVWKWKGLSQDAGGIRTRNLMTVIFGTSILWGVIVGSYFGMTPPDGSFLGKLKILDVSNTSLMMLISLSIGVFHLSLANIMDAWRKRKSVEIFSPLGWLCIIVGGFVFALGSKDPSTVMIKSIGMWTAIVGAAMLIFFASPNTNFFKRIFGGISSLTRLSSAFGDVLSYLRLFALGLAGASLGATFNSLAKQTFDGMPGIGGIIFGLMILFLGHVMNLVLSIMSCFVHGLRLNVIEFFNWSMYEDGRPFRPFAIKGGGPWNNSL